MSIDIGHAFGYTLLMKPKKELTTEQKFKELLKDFNQTMIAEKLGCRTETVNRWCRGKRKISKVYSRLISDLHEEIK